MKDLPSPLSPKERRGSSHSKATCASPLNNVCASYCVLQLNTAPLSGRLAQDSDLPLERTPRDAFQGPAFCPVSLLPTRALCCPKSGDAVALGSRDTWLSRTPTPPSSWPLSPCPQLQKSRQRKRKAWQGRSEASVGTGISAVILRRS